MTELDSMTVALQRGLIVTVASSGVYSGKPRPAVVVQANRWLQGHPSVTLCPLTSTLLEAPLVRIPVNPSGSNGLHKSSQLMADKLFTVPTAAVGAVVGILESRTLAELDLALRSWLDYPDFTPTPPVHRPGYHRLPGSRPRGTATAP